MGININAAFPSTYLKAADLGGKMVKAIIDKVVMEDIGDDHKPVLYFQGKQKGMVLNKTNAMTIADVYGEDTDNWPGAEVTLFTAKVSFNNRMVDGLRLSVAKPAPARAAPAAVTTLREDLSDDIPF